MNETTTYKAAIKVNTTKNSTNEEYLVILDAISKEQLKNKINNFLSIAEREEHKYEKSSCVIVRTYISTETNITLD